MIAELEGKINVQNTNLTALREDELTGNFFGNLRYIPFSKGMKKILQNSVRPVDLQDMIEEIQADEWAENIFFWEKMEESGRSTELDVRLDFPTVVIGIEVKYKSGLSSEDEDSAEEIPAEESVNQLSREARVLNLIGSGKKKLLLLLADDLDCVKMIQEVKIVDGVRLGYFSWQEALMQLYALSDLTYFEQLVVSDLIRLLQKKGFSRFSNFQWDTPVVNDWNAWEFITPPAKYGFSFHIQTAVEDKAYEFR